MINVSDVSSVRVATLAVGCHDPRAGERCVQNATDAMQHQIIERRADAANPALPQTALDRLLSTPGLLDRFGESDPA